MRLLPTPGHTPGHSCVLVDMRDYQLLVTGDCLYTLRHLATDQVQAFRLSKKTGQQQKDSINRIAGLQVALPQLQLLVGHDHTAYQTDYLAPLLAKGSLSESDRRALTEYRAKLFNPDGTLRATALPQFQFQVGEATGKVREPIIACGTPSGLLGAPHTRTSVPRR